MAPDPDSATIDGQELGTVVTFDGNETSAEIRGFTITGGVADSGGAIFVSSDPTIRAVMVEDNSASKGGGIYIHALASPTIRNVTLRNNSSSVYGGGIFIEGLSSTETITIDSCDLVGNTAGSMGGGIASTSVFGTVIITNCTLDSNYANYGGGIYSSGNDSIVNCIIENDIAVYVGGGIYSDDTTSKIIDNTIQYNRASKGGGVGVYKDEEWTSATIKDNLIDHNEATKGGGIYFHMCSGLISGNTIKSNEANRGGAIYQWSGSATITKNFMDSNTAPTDSVDGVFIGGNASLTVCTTNVIIKHTWNLYYAGGFTLNAKKNHWGTIDTDSVDAHIGTCAAWDTVDFDPIMYSGHIPYNSVCSTDVVVNADIWVPTNTKLTIAEGRSIEFFTSDDSASGDDTSRCELIVNGFLDATGSSSSRILFTSNDSLSRDDWYGIRFENSSNDSSVIRYADISYAFVGISCDSASPTIEHNRVEQGGWGILLNNSTPKLNHNFCTDHWYSGIKCLNSYDPAAIISYNECKNCTWGMDLRDNSSPTVYEGSFINNHYGIVCYNQSSPDINHTDMSNNSFVGLQCLSYSSPILSYRNRPLGYPEGGYNDIIGNDQYGTSGNRSSYPHLGGKYPGGYGWGNNSIDSSGMYEIGNLNSSGCIMAERNWWGSPSGPDSSDFDGCVDWFPYLTSPPGGKGGSLVGGENDSSNTQSEADYYNEIGTGYWFQGLYEDAIDVFEFVLSEYSNSPEVDYALSHVLLCYRDLGRQAEIVSYLETVAETYDGYDMRRLTLELSIPHLTQVNQHQLALQRCDYLIDNYENEEMQKNLLFQKGMIYKYGLGNASEAERVFIRFLELYPTHDLALMAEAELTTSGYSGGGGAVSSAEAVDQPRMRLASQAYPNPFSSEVAIAYELPWTTSVTVTIYDASGRLIRTLVDEVKQAGYYTVSWRGDDVHGTRLPTGVYFASIVSEKSKSTSKLLLVR